LPIAALEDAVTFLAPVAVAGFSAEDGAGVLTLADGRTVRAPLVIAADGQRSALREMAGIATIGHAYRQAGIVTTIRHARDHEGTAFEHFRPAGPFASLPLLDADGAGTRSSLVWTESPEAAERYRALPLGEVAAIIEGVMGSSLGAVELEEPLQIFPLRLQLA